MPLGMALPLRNALQMALAFEPVGRTARTLSDWVDLEQSSVVSALQALAPQTKGRLLDVGCGEKPYESIFVPYVDTYQGIEYEETFDQTSASSKPRKADFTYDGKVLPFED